MSEASQELVLERLMPWQEKIVSLMQNGRTLFLWVGNALELLGAYIQREDGSRVAGLGVFFSMYSVRQSPQRFNNLIRADFKGTKLIGYTSRFSHTYGLSKEYALCQTEIGASLEKLPYEDAMRQAYAYKMKEMDNPDLKLF